MPKTSLVENSIKRSTVSFVASAASRALYVPMRLTRIVRTGLSMTVSTPAIAAACTTCVAPRTTSVEEGRVEDVALHEREVRMLGERGAAERVAMQVVDGDDLVLVDQPPGERRPDEARAARDRRRAFRSEPRGESSDRRRVVLHLEARVPLVVCALH